MISIIYELDADGGFTCGDTKTRRTAYAYPTSKYAEEAVKAPSTVALKMMEKEMQRSEYHRFDDRRILKRLRRKASADDTSIRGAIS